MTCPNGKHIMDPSWPECPYCRSEGLLPPAPPSVPSGPGAGDPNRRSTVAEATQAPPPAPFQPRTFPENQRPSGSTQSTPPSAGPPSKAPANPARNPTVFTSTVPPVGAVGSGTPPKPSLSTSRKIVGLLITYSWRPEGQLFPIREGRNLIGRDSECEVCVSEDQTMSGRNSHITFRNNFVVGDLVSMMGTYLNETPVEEQFTSLANYAHIRAGSTHFTFIMIQPPE